MADFAFNASTTFNAGGSQNDRFENIDLPEIPKSIAPSASTSRYSLFIADDDDKSLLEHFQPTSYAATKGNGLVEIVSQTPTARASRERKRQLSGWRFGVTVAACAALVVMLINLILVIVAAVKFRDNITDGIGTAYQGDCNVVDEWSTALHIIINVLSSLLLSASNYTMQCLCSPTRKEIDLAHSRGDWLDIGLPSVRNILGRINWYRISFWWVLALSSAPIHLLYNSSAFKTLDANLYDAAVVNTDFLDGLPFSTNITIHPNAESSYPEDASYWYPELRRTQAFFADNYTNKSAVQNLSNADCITAYGSFFVSGRNDVLLITGATGTAKDDTFFYNTKQQNLGAQFLSYNWICNAGTGQNLACDIPTVRNDADNWKVNGYKIEYCLSQVVRPNCKLQFSLTILGVVIAMNFCKCASMFWTIFWQKSTTLVTTGDAVASFLDCPDPLTAGRCLTSKADIASGPLRWRLQESKLPNTRPPAIVYQTPIRRRWFAAASAKRWIISMSLCVSALITGATLLGIGVRNLGLLNPGQDPLKMGFGKVDSRALINYGLSRSLAASVLLANLPQAIVSFLYLTYNGLLTSMLLSSEWSRYFLRPKSLRTTTPHGAQRSTYYLQLPYTYSAPLLIASAMLHWLISESIFLARIEMWGDGKLKGTSSEVGYSCLPILVVLLLGIAMLSAAFILGFRRFSSYMPVAGSCSVAIAAACHRPKDDVDAAYLPVSWGEVDREDSSDEIYHCCFTSQPTRELVPGRLYAGERHDVKI